MSELLIARIARRAANQETQIDVRGLSRQSPAAPLRRADAEASERELGFPIPELLKLVYEKVGNGGFGPGYGLMGIRSGATDDQGQNAIDAYKNYSSSDPSDPSWTWPEGLLPICHWGCAIYSCIDCKAAGFPVFIFDPNMHETTWDRCFIPSKRNLESWLDAWAAGINLWDEIYDGAQGP
jgi:hypothetical protein